MRFSGHGARACSAGVGQQTGSRQSACRPISCAVTSAEIFLFAEWQPHTHGGGCEQAVVRSWQLSKQRSLATASNIVFAGFFQIGQRLCVQNSYWVLQAAFLLGTSGSIFERRMISPRRRFGAMELHKILPEIPKGRKSRFGNANLLARFSG